MHTNGIMDLFKRIEYEQDCTRWVYTGNFRSDSDSMYVVVKQERDGGFWWMVSVATSELADGLGCIDISVSGKEKLLVNAMEASLTALEHVESMMNGAKEI